MNYREKLIEQKVSIFKSMLNEAVRDKDVARARELIIKYLTKKVGMKFVPLPAEDFTNNVDGRATGLRFVFNKNDSIRFNWAGTKAGGNELTSVDVWLSGKYYPDFNLPLKGVSLARALPTIAEFLNDPSGDEYAIIPEAESMSEMFDISTPLSEGRKAGYSKHSAEDLWKLVMSYLKKGEPVKHSEIFATSQKAYKIYTEIKKTFPEMWDKKIYIGDNFKLQQNEGRILKQLGLIQVVVQKGATSETPIVELPDEVIALELEMKKGQDNIGYEDAVEDLKSGVRLLKKGVTNALFISGRGGTGKTFNVEQELAALGLSDGDGYFKVTGSATPAIAYKLMYEHNGEILFFDDCDTMLKDQEGRNLFKNATDTGKVRKLSWQKARGQKFEDPETGEMVEVPATFEYTGKIIFISNLQIDKLDPDKALRTRALLIDINPTDDELLGLVRKILMTFKIPKPGTDGKDLSFEERNEVLDLVSAKKGLYNINFRAVERALGYRSALEPEGLDWATYVKRYAVIPE